MRLIASSSYLPSRIITNKEIAEKLNVSIEFIEKRNRNKTKTFCG